MDVPVVMPQLGLTMTEGSVSEWLKKPGDPVRKGEMLFVVSTDKADMEVESLDEGKLAQIVVEPGRTVPVGTVIAYLAGTSSASAPRDARPQTVEVAVPHPAVEQPAPASAGELSVKAAQSRKDGPPSSPRARKVARELGIDIAQVPSGSPSGRIVEEDVRRFAASIQARPLSARPGSLPAQAMPQTGGHASPSAKVATGAVDLRRRRIIAERLTTSIQTIPHFSVSAEVRADTLVNLRESLKQAVEKEAGAKLTITDLLLKALARALADTPEMQAVWADGNPQAATAIDLGLAVASDRGVAAPVIRNLAALDLAEIARRRLDLSQKARSGRLGLGELEGGLGTLSNLGKLRVDRFQAIINPGQSFILATGRIAPRPWVEAGALIVAQTLSLTLSVDHRVADGALAGEFLERIAAIIENPYRILGTPAKT